MPRPLQVDLWPFHLESGVWVTCEVCYLCANFSLPRHLCYRLRPDVRDGQTSDAHHSLMPPPYGGGGIISHHCSVKELMCILYLGLWRQKPTAAIDHWGDRKLWWEFSVLASIVGWASEGIRSVKTTLSGNPKRTLTRISCRTPDLWSALEADKQKTSYYNTHSSPRITVIQTILKNT